LTIRSGANEAPEQQSTPKARAGGNVLASVGPVG
jgi:hypothetical protein